MANPDGPWIRFYASDWLAGTRGMTAAETGVYITLIALMYERDDGKIERDDKRLARMCGLKQHAFIAILEDLIEQGKITSEGTKLGNHRATYESQNRADRAIKARNAALAKAQRNQGEVSASAPPKQSVSSAPRVPRARASEPEPDSDIERDTIVSPKKIARGTRLPADWEIPPDWGRWACSEFGLPANTVRAQADRFRDYWIAQPGQKGVKLDWLATWRNWCRTAFTPKAGNQPRTSQPTAADIGRQLLEEMENGSPGSARSVATDHPPARQLSARAES
jgi:uncharacterized protein YdaU (DUF1376 family)